MLRDRMDSLVRSVFCNVGAVAVIILGVLVLGVAMLAVVSATGISGMPPLPRWGLAILFLWNACTFVYWQRKAKHHCSTYWDQKRRERRG